MTGLIDWHSHMLCPDLIPPARATGAWPGVRSGADGYELTLGGAFYRTVDERTFQATPRLADMDRTGVSMQVLSAPPYAVGFDGPAEEVTALTLQHNEFLASVVAAHPDRFAMLAMLPYGDEAAVTAELTRLQTVPGVLGVCFTPNRDDYLCGLEHRGLWESLARSGLLVFVHPADTHMPDCDLATSAVFGAGMPLSTARTATRFITSGLLSSIPDVRVLLAHAGGALPSTIHRLDYGWRLGQPAGLVESPLAVARRAFWADAIAYGAEPLRLAADVFGADRLVYGSDYPFPALMTPQQLDALNPAAGYVDRVRDSGNRLLAHVLAGRQ